jgi:hypothetical protein
LSSRGKIVRNGVKRVDGVVVKNEDGDQQSQKTHCMDIDNINEDDDTETNSLMPLEPQQSLTRVEIISNISILRFGYKRLNIDAKELKNRNFSRIIKDDASIFNVIEELED